jgi:hypothetical protein
MGDHVEGLRDRVRPIGGDTGQIAELPADDVHRHPGEKAGHHRIGHEPGVTAQPQQPRNDHDQAGEHGEQEQRLRPLIGIQARHRGAGGKGRGGGRGDHHQLSARGQATGKWPSEAGIQTVHWVHTHQHGRRHPIGNTADRARQARHQILAEMLPIRLDRPSPGPQADPDPTEASRAVSGGCHQWTQ